MIYLDSAATSLLKPAVVRQSMSLAVQNLSSPGRGGYDSAMAAADVLLDCRTAIADMFCVPSPEQVVFTANATHGLNIAIKALVKRGDRVVISGYEHNAVVRPLYAVGARIDTALSPLFAWDSVIAAFRKKLPGASCAVCTHISNAFGYILPIAEIASLCRGEGVPLIIDASQSAGVLGLDFQALGCEFAAMPGHKGLLGPQGTGVLLCAHEPEKTIMEGGTGSESKLSGMPGYLPDRLEPGTHNVPGIAGLLAGVRWVSRRTTGSILHRERELLSLFSERLSGADGLTMWRSEEENLQSGVLSLRIDTMDCETVAEELNRMGIAVRAGLHCAPLAHRTVGTDGTGTVRISFSPFTKEDEAAFAADAIRSFV